MVVYSLDNPITTILVDDHPVVRAGYCRLLESEKDITVVAEACDGETGCILYKKFKPDVLILDLNMPGIGGLETIRRIRAEDSDAHILVFSILSSEVMVQHALKAGAVGFITKQCAAKQMIQAIRLVSQNEIYIDSELVSSIATNLVFNNLENPLSVLTERELQIFKLLAEGESCTYIAEILSISSKTVGVHHTNIMKKLKLRNAVQLIRLAISCDVIHA